MHVAVQDRTHRAGLLRTLIVSSTALVCMASAWAHPPHVDKSPQSVAGQAISQAAQDLTLTVIDASHRVANATAGGRAQEVAKLVAVAKSRHDAILALLPIDPSEALKVALPPGLRAQFPGEAAPFIEQDVTEEGDLEVYHVDYEDASLDHYEYALSTRSGRLALYFGEAPADAATGAHVRVTALKLDGALLAASGDSMTVTKATALPNTLGAQKTLTVLVNFTDNAVQPFTVASAQATMFQTVSNYWYENSYQQTTLTGDVAGWFTVAPSTATCDYTYVASAGKKAAQAAGYNLSSYNRYLFVFPNSGCGWAGLSYVGGIPSESWVISSYFNLRIIAHELGHGLGLYHSHSLDCGTAAIAGSGCATSEYGDVFDVMGSASMHYNAFQKERLGWLNAGVSPPITAVATGSGTYSIGPLETARNATPRAIKVARAAACGSASDYFYVEERQAIGFDSSLASNPSLLGGVLVHDATPSSPDTSYLLDMTPATASWSDAALPAGVPFADPASGVTITPVSVGSSGSTVNVTYPAAACTRAAPKVTLTPTGTVYTSAGSVATYTATVTNNDSCGCASSAFSIGAAVPAGWTASNPQTGTIAPGTTTSASLGIATAANAAAAFYTIPSTATNTSAPAYVTSANATVAVVVATSFTVSAAASQATYSRPGRPSQTTYATITTTAMNGSVPVSGAAVSVNVVDSGGKLTTLTGTTGSTGTAVVSYALKTKSKTGTYTVTSTATLGSMTQSGTTSFVVK